MPTITPFDGIGTDTKVNSWALSAMTAGRILSEGATAWQNEPSG
jgi:hypothetical protein